MRWMTFWVHQVLSDERQGNLMSLNIVFSCINICWVSRKLFDFEAARPRVQTSKNLPRDSANVNAMKQRCMIVIVAYLLIPLLNRIENSVKLLKLMYLYVESFCRKWRQRNRTSLLLTASTQQKLWGSVIPGHITSHKQI